jgi:Amt family ammonium transporter
MNGLEAAVRLSAVLVPLLPLGLVLVWGGGPGTVPLARSVLAAAAVVGVLWVLVGAAIVFGADGGIGLPGVFALDPKQLAFADAAAKLFAGTGTGTGAGAGVAAGAAIGRIAFTGALALLPTAIAAVGASRSRRTPWLLFAGGWNLLVVFPELGWIFDLRYTDDGGATGGWLVAGLQGSAGAGLLDFSGGTLHVAGGAAALALLLVVRGSPAVAHRSSDGILRTGAVLATIGALIATVGAEGTADSFAALALLNSTAAAGAGALTGLGIAWLSRDRTPTSAAAAGLIAGVAAAASAGPSIAPLAAVLVGVLSAGACAAIARLAARRSPHPAVRAAIAHLGGGALGLVCLGVLANDTGMAYSGRFSQLLAQATGVISVFLYSFVVAALIGLLLDRTLGFRTRKADAGPKDVTPVMRDSVSRAGDAVPGNRVDAPAARPVPSAGAGGRTS